MQLFDTTDLHSLQKAVSDLQKTTPSKSTIYLHGDLGAGKTTFVQLWLALYGYKGNVISPTYNLVNEYEINNITFIHSDLYRLNQPDEILYLDIDEWQQRADFIFIEWPEKAEGFLPPANFHAFLTLNLSDKKRALKWTHDE